jgi:hypothetical protein
MRANKWVHEEKASRFQLIVVCSIPVTSGFCQTSWLRYAFNSHGLDATEGTFDACYLLLVAGKTATLQLTPAAAVIGAAIND